MIEGKGRTGRPAWSMGMGMGMGMRISTAARLRD
jgi:hypothetical protein